MSDSKRTTTPSEADAELLARAALYRLIARLFADPLHSRRAKQQDLEIADAAARFLADPEAVRLIAGVGKQLPASEEDAREIYTSVFGLLVSPEAPPYEIEYEQRTDVFWRASRMADIAAFHKAFGLELTGHERQDNVSVEADFLWYLLERLVAASMRQHGKEKRDLLASALTSYFREHFAAWTPSFASVLARVAKARRVTYYLAASRLLDHVVAAETARMGLNRAALRQPVVTQMPGADECVGCTEVARSTRGLEHP